MDCPLFGPYLGHVWTMIEPYLAQWYIQTIQRSEIYKFDSMWSLAHFWRLSTLWGNVNAMFGPSWDPVWPNFISRLATVKTFLRPSLYVISNLNIECPLFWIMAGPCCDYVCSNFSLIPATAKKISKLFQHDHYQNCPQLFLVKNILIMS